MKKRVLTRKATLTLLDGLAATPGNENLSLYLPPLIPSAELENILKGLPSEADIRAQIAGMATASPTGAVVFWGRGGKYLILPPFPVAEKYITKSLNIEKLRSFLSQEYLIALVLVRLGAYAIGVCAGEKLITSKVGTGLVHGRHRQGGSSAHRFERHRDKQIETFLNRVCGHVREQLEPHAKNLDYIVYGGARRTISLLQKYCPLLMKLEIPTLPPLLEIPDPRQAVLERAVESVWSSTVVEWGEGVKNRE